MAFDESQCREATSGGRFFSIKGSDPDGAGKPQFMFALAATGDFDGFLPEDCPSVIAAACGYLGFSPEAVNHIRDMITELMELSQPDFG